MNSNTFILNETTDDKVPLLSQNPTLQCRVSPLVVMAILNHFQRRPSNKQQSKNKSGTQPLYPQYVIGLLFGNKQSTTNSIIINDAFGLEVQLNPQDQAVAVNADNAIKAMELHATAHPNDRLVGWYRTGLSIDIQSNSIHQTILIKTLINLSNKMSKKAGPELDQTEYIHLLVDTTLKYDKLSLKAYTTLPINDPLQEMEYAEYIKEKKRRERLAKQKQQNPNSKSSKARKRRRNRGGSSSNNQQQQQPQQQQNNEDSKINSSASTTNTSQQESPLKEVAIKEKKEEKEEEPLEEVEKPYPIFYRFKEVTTSYLASESEKIGLDMIIESPPEGNALDSPSMLMNDTNHLESVLQLLLQNLEQVENYVHQVINGEIDGNESIGWLIGDALSSVPNLSPSKFEQMISNRLQDFLMMVYLGKMTKAQLVIADKINKILPSTVPGFEDNN